MRRSRCRSGASGVPAAAPQRTSAPTSVRSRLRRAGRVALRSTRPVATGWPHPNSDLRPFPQLADGDEGEPDTRADDMTVYPLGSTGLLNDRRDVGVDDDVEHARISRAR